VCRERYANPFSAADILMTSVLRILRHIDLLEEQPALGGGAKIGLESIDQLGKSKQLPRPSHDGDRHLLGELHRGLEMFGLRAGSLEVAKPIGVVSQRGEAA
jgi:hypothetical protein